MTNADTALRAGTDALARGDPRAALEHLAMAVRAGRHDVPVMFALALACRGVGDRAGGAAALDRLLSIEPDHVIALILRGDLFAAANDIRSAASFYRGALRAAPPAGQRSAELDGELARAQQVVDQYAKSYEEFLLRRLGERGFDAQHSSRRFAESVDIAIGRKSIYVQQPRYYYFPGLPQIQFYDRRQFPWLEAIEAATNDIRSELLGVMRDETAFKPYVTSVKNRPPKPQAGLVDNPDWSAFYLVKDGDVVQENAERCPRTMAAIAAAPLAQVPNRSPSVLFSLLRPGMRIPPHHGFVNTRLICHLPLIVPGRCTLRVGNATRQWVLGEALVFDDTIEHEATNESDETRVILLFDVWRPELTPGEQNLVAALFGAIDTYSGNKAAWEL